MKNGIKSTVLKLPPPIFYVTALLIGLGLQYFFPLTFLSAVWHYSIVVLAIPYLDTTIFMRLILNNSN